MRARLLMLSMLIAASAWTGPALAAPKAQVAASDLDDMVDDAVQSFKTGQVKAAIHTLHKCIAKNKNYAACQRTLGIMYGKTGDLPKASGYLKAYLKLQPKAADAAHVRELVQAYEAASAG